MNEPTIKKSTKKAFHFPKGAAGTVVESDVVAEPATPKVARQKRAAAVEAKPVAAAPEEKVKRVKKEKVVRDSFTMPKSDYAKIATLKQKCLDAGISVKKSELLRAGLLLLASTPDKRLLAAVSAVETIKTGRPAKS
ncbi:hypothetical protein [Paraburkholderia sp. GAS42]|uniref:hypothetical protein n=1 Tax=Paraburkholderia sp. GAS42 TaxID=3035135 RepID=UPI003D1CFFFA